MHKIVTDTFYYGENANKTNYDNRTQPISCSYGNIYCSARHLTEEAAARVKYVNGGGYDPVYVDYSTIMCNNEHADPEETETESTENNNDDHNYNQYCDTSYPIDK